MQRTRLLSLIRGSFGPQGFWSEIKNPGSFPQRCYSNDLKPTDKSKSLEEEEKLKEIKQLEQRLALFDHRKRFLFPSTQIWNERAAIKKAKKDNQAYKKIKSATDLMKYLQDFQKLPRTWSELYYYLGRRKVRKQLLEQQYLPQRHAVLKADLAAATFILQRRGQVKFVGQEEWLGIPGVQALVPKMYSPSFHVEAINAEGTNLYYEGLQNLCDLRHLTWLCLKNLENMNDWCMDWISREYADTLTYLDISGCKNITYRGFSCFYRFNELKTLVVKGVSESADFKLACLMLQDIKPYLEIEGIDLTIPKKIEPIEAEEVKELDKKS